MASRRTAGPVPSRAGTIRSPTSTAGENLDWFDLSFGRGTAKQSDFPEEFIHKFDWEKWKSKLTQEDLKPLLPNPSRSPIAPTGARRILWALGQKPEED